MFMREHVERIVKECFTSFGGGQLDTPVFERKDILTDKYGEDSKLIFDLMDQGGEQLAMHIYMLHVREGSRREYIDEL